MSEIVIDAHGLCKQYAIGALHKRNDTLRDQIVDTMWAPFRRVQSLLKPDRRSESKSEDSIWALDDVSFQVREGDVVGVIGRNGAGKSTLLKILSRITEPTKGYADIRGRIASLLEVGTGFHAELTGRENVFLNGAILGMRRDEIIRKFDEIVAFAEIEKFLDTPVKRYSTGMYMRLGFAVAASLDPEILIVDEVLAVGDAAFQKKCLGKMAGVAKEGRTVIFVSHNMAAIQSLCNRCLYIEAGRLRVAGSLQDGIGMYHRSMGEEVQGNRKDSGEVTISGLTVNGPLSTSVDASKPMRFEFELSSRVSFSGFRMFLIIENPHGTTVMHSVINERKHREIDGEGVYHVSVDVPTLWLTPGMYSATVKLICNGVGLKGRYLSDKLLIMVQSDYDPDAAPGMLTPPVTWKVASSQRADTTSRQTLEYHSELNPSFASLDE
jgi:lipopolysaccharide transport system ATP-binding protein